MENFKTACGLDEAGRGALAGPLVLAAVVLPQNFSFDSITKVKIRDSKKLSLTQRIKALEVIKKYSLVIETEIINVDEINQQGIQWANIEGFKRLIKRVSSDSYIVDGRWKLDGLEEKQSVTSCLVDADAIFPAAIAAGIVAKCTRDEIMQDLNGTFPGYYWHKNVGYGTLMHLQGLKSLGPSVLHRTQFIKTALGI